MQSSWVTSGPVTSPGRGRVTWPQRAGGRGAKWLRGSYIGGLHAPGYMAPAGPGYTAGLQRAGGSGPAGAGQRAGLGYRAGAGASPEGSGQPEPGYRPGQPGPAGPGPLGLAGGRVTYAGL